MPIAITELPLTLLEGLLNFPPDVTIIRVVQSLQNEISKSFTLVISSDSIPEMEGVIPNIKLVLQPDGRIELQ